MEFFFHGLKLNEPTFLPNALYSTQSVNSKFSNRLHLLPSNIHVYIPNQSWYNGMWNLHLSSITLVCCLLLNIPIEIISSKWEHLPTCIWHDLNGAHNVYIIELSYHPCLQYTSTVIVTILTRTQSLMTTRTTSNGAGQSYPPRAPTISVRMTRITKSAWKPWAFTSTTAMSIFSTTVE